MNREIRKEGKTWEKNTKKLWINTISQYFLIDAKVTKKIMMMMIKMIKMMIKMINMMVVIVGDNNHKIIIEVNIITIIINKKNNKKRISVKIKITNNLNKLQKLQIKKYQKSNKNMKYLNFLHNLAKYNVRSKEMKLKE